MPVAARDVGGAPWRGSERSGLVLIFVGLLFLGLTLRAAYPDQPQTTTSGVDPAEVDTPPVAVSTDDLQPGGFQDVVADSFDRPESEGGLGTAETGQAWRSISGTWSIQDDTAARSTAGARDLVVVETSASDGLLEVTLTSSAPGIGLVFRYESRFNYWLLINSPPLGTWNLMRVVDGESLIRGSLGSDVPTGDGTRVSALLEGTELTFYVNGVRRLALSDLSHRDATVVGLAALPESRGRGAWDNFSFGVTP